MNNLALKGSGRSALVVAPRYFGYDVEICLALKRLGIETDLLPDRPFTAPILKAVTRFQPRLTLGVSDRFFEAELERLGRGDYDFIIVIEGEAVSRSTLALCRQAFPRAKLIFYTWDSLGNKQFSQNKLSAFDRCLTFDPADAKAFGMAFRPLFFTPGFERAPRANFDHEISFVGTIHSDRYRVIQRVNQQLPAGTRCYWFLFMQAQWMFWARKYFTRSIVGANMYEFRFASLPKDEVQRIFFGSRAVLDIEHPKQSGLTMRTLETIGSQTKLITTNTSVQDYDFFDPENICVVDRRNPVIPTGFFDGAYKELPTTIYDRYKLSSWCHEVCQL
jgi:hypothetical protein